MKKAIFWFLGLLVLSCGFFVLGRLYHNLHSCSQSKGFLAENQRFSPAAYPIHHQNFVIFISAYNNGAYVEKTLKSISRQAYDQYRLIYVDDASTDGSYELALDRIHQSNLSDRTIFVRNEKKLGQLACLVNAMQACEDREIVVLMQGEDCLAHEWVLSRLNQYYANNDLWLTYNQYREYPTYRLGLSRSYQGSEWKELRQVPFHATHLQTFYASLFKNIHEADLMMQGSFILERADLAMMLPMMEMAQDHFQFIPEILYIVNPKTASLENREQEIRSERYIRSLKPYAPLTSFPAVSGFAIGSNIKEDS